MKRMHTKEFIENIAKSLIEQLGGSKIKTGSFIPDEDGNLIYVKTLTDDYTGNAININSDYISVAYYVDGNIDTESYIGFDEIQLPDGLIINSSGINKVQPFALVGLTHSFAELDETLQGIVQDAFENAGQNGVPCTQAQWNVIKELLDKSLYINYNGWSMIKVVTDGIGKYKFGSYGIADDLIGASLDFNFSEGTLWVIGAEL